MGRTYSAHEFYVIVPTRYADEIVTRWGWQYCKEFHEIPRDDDTKAYYQFARSSESLGLTVFEFDSIYYWPNTKMMDDVYEIRDQLRCRVLTVYCAGPEITQTLIDPDAEKDISVWDVFDDTPWLCQRALNMLCFEPIQTLRHALRPPCMWPQWWFDDSFTTNIHLTGGTAAPDDPQ